MSISTESHRNTRAVVLLSGGLDSCVAAALAVQSHELFCLHAGYGQRTAAREACAAIEVAAALKADLRCIDLAHIAAFGGSNLTAAASPREPGDLEWREVPATYVPFRNANLLAAGVSYAEAIGAAQVFIGIVEEDSSGYPDCRETFLDAFQQAVIVGTAAADAITLSAPLLHMNKGEIVKLGFEIGAPLHATWSCYYDDELACGECDSCLLRLRGFAAAGKKDPLPYR